MLNKLRIGLELNAPDTSFNLELCIVLTVLKCDGLELIKKKEHIQVWIVLMISKSA